ncbi:response regulator [Candidatus Magnetaquicoccus inordinatus]|uniref:response regulator n=1 Tax=Candidatus Magnetaquicoccus inordinatus TaxID=2496818 RepID=UPI00102BAB08|nr:response regulator [Candidatus Magnetaquicoccus inordinatus]
MSIAVARWKIVTRIFAGFIGLCVLMLLSGTVSFRDLIILDDNFDHYAEVTEETGNLVVLEQSLSDLRQKIYMTMLSGDEKKLQESQELLGKTQQWLALVEEHLLQSEESVTLYRIGEIVESLRSGLPRLTELIAERQRLFHEQWLPAEQEVTELLATAHDGLRIQGDEESADKIADAVQHLHRIGLLLARLPAMNNSEELARVAEEGEKFRTLMREITEKMPAELQVAMTGLGNILQHYLKVEGESAERAHTILEGESAEFATLTRGLVAGHSRQQQRLNNETSERNHAAIRFVGIMLLLVCAVSIVVASWLAFGISRPLQAITGVVSRLAAGEWEIKIPGLKRQDEIGEMARALHVVQRNVQEVELQHWVKNNTMALNQLMVQAMTVPEFAQGLVEQWIPLLGGIQGALFYFDEGVQRLRRYGGYALTARAAAGSEFALGESIVGQCAASQRLLEWEGVPHEYSWIHSGIGETAALRLTVVPLIWQGRMQGVLEFSSFLPRSERQNKLLEEVSTLAALHLELMRRSVQTQELLQQTQQQTEELRASQSTLLVQEEALQRSNQQLRERGELLESQTEELRTSEEELRIQGEELRVANETLAEKAKMLEEREKALIEARQEAEKRAFERELASRYKSEFLANMSHELRTPLNSLLILAESLAGNGEGNLHPEQVESATIIHESGTHLLRLINDILDIAKVEAGRMDVVVEAVVVEELLGVMERRFRRMAQSRGIVLLAESAVDVGRVLYTDRGKVEQILTNLLGNAIKFTERGEVRLQMIPWTGQGIGVRVSDSGIGIAPDKLEHIFEAFTQENGTTGRRFGGTGLGLTIARTLTQLLGGEIEVSSQQGVGSQFTVWLPSVGEAAVTGIRAESDEELSAGAIAGRAITSYPLDDREQLQEGDAVILLVEDDPVFAGITYTQARSKGLRCLLAPDGESALQLAQRYRPMGIVLDVGLPDMDGWEVMNRLKQDPQTQAIPVHFISAVDARLRALGMGAVGFLSKPVSKEQLTMVFDRVSKAASVASQKHVLVLDGDEASRREMVQLLQHGGVVVEEAASGEGCLSRLRVGGVHCLIVDLGGAINEMVAFLHRLVSELAEAMPPLVVYSPRHLTADELLHFREFTDSIIVRSDRSNERLQEEVDSFLAEVQEQFPRQSTLLEQDLAWPGVKVLVVDDDMRNTFSLSKMLRSKGLKVLMAQDGNKALAQLASNSDVQLVLMDIMMPDKDGYQTMQEIRAQEQFGKLPIIALTAKAMSGERERCLAAGANDYLSKPVVMEDLLRKMVRLFNEQEQKERR